MCGLTIIIRCPKFISAKDEGSQRNVQRIYIIFIAVK